MQEHVGHSDYKKSRDIHTHVTNQMAKDMLNKFERLGS